MTLAADHTFDHNKQKNPQKNIINGSLISEYLPIMLPFH